MNLDEKIKEIEQIHKEYLVELKSIEAEQDEAIRAFLEKVKEKKIAELKQQILNS